MKTLILLFASIVSLSGFSLDFASVSPSTFTQSSPLIIPVAGYGNVMFTPTDNSVMVVNDTNNQPPTIAAIALQPAKTLNVYFAGTYAPEIDSVEFDFKGASVRDGLLITRVDSRNFEISLGNRANGVGLIAAHFTAVPEPSTSILSCFGIGLMWLRRRRS